jgi:hypothetical protein
MFNWLNRKLTKNYNEVLLFWVDFNLNKYNEFGAKNSCTVKIHPELKDDEYVIDTLNDLVDYIRIKYDMNDLSK